MNKVTLRKLAIASYEKNELSWKKISKIIMHLKKTELKHYIKLLKLLEKQKTISIVLPKTSSKQKNNIVKKLNNINECKNKFIYVSGDLIFIYSFRISIKVMYI